MGSTRIDCYTQDVITGPGRASEGATMADDSTGDTGTTPAQDTSTAPVQTELPIQTRPAAVAAPATAAHAGPDPVKLAEMMADNKTMKARIAELTAAQGQEAQERREASERAQLDKHRGELEALRNQASAASASAKRNAVKAHYNGQLKSDEYLALVPQTEFTEAGDLTPESIELLNQFRSGKPELFVQASTATTPMSQSGQTQNAHGFDADTTAALKGARVSLPGTPGHWSNRQNADLMRSLYGHNSNTKAYGDLQ